MNNFCMLLPNNFTIQKGVMIDDCRVEDKVKVTTNLFNYNNVYQNNSVNKYPYPGVVPAGPATGSWPSRNQETCNYFNPSNPCIDEKWRKVDLMSLPPN